MNDEQLRQLKSLWQVYGNHGPKFTIGNHKILQKLIHRPDSDFEKILAQYREMFTEGGGGPRKVMTDECLGEIRRILNLPA